MAGNGPGPLGLQRKPCSCSLPLWNVTSCGVTGAGARLDCVPAPTAKLRNINAQSVVLANALGTLVSSCEGHLRCSCKQSRIGLLQPLEQIFPQVINDRNLGQF